jgi:hypothetical protein
VASQPLSKLTPSARLYAPLVWQTPVPPGFVGHRIALRFHLRAAHLYSFRFIV